MAALDCVTCFWVLQTTTAAVAATIRETRVSARYATDELIAVWHSVTSVVRNFMSCCIKTRHLTQQQHLSSGSDTQLHPRPKAINQGDYSLASRVCNSIHASKSTSKSTTSCVLALEHVYGRQDFNQVYLVLTLTVLPLVYLHAAASHVHHIAGG